MCSRNKPFETTGAPCRVARRLPAEDIAAGDDVAASRVAYQFPSFCWCPADTSVFPPEQPVRIAFLPFDESLPLKVQSVCLPFVLCHLPDGTPRIHDVRQVEFVRLDPEFAAAVRNALEKHQSDKAESSGKKRKRKK